MVAVLKAVTPPAVVEDRERLTPLLRDNEVLDDEQAGAGGGGKGGGGCGGGEGDDGSAPYDSKRSSVSSIIGVPVNSDVDLIGFLFFK